MIVPLYTVLVRPYLEYCVQALGPQYRMDMELVEWDQRGATKMIRGLKHLSCEEKVEGTGLVQLENRVSAPQPLGSVSAGGGTAVYEGG